MRKKRTCINALDTFLVCPGKQKQKKKKKIGINYNKLKFSEMNGLHHVNSMQKKKNGKRSTSLNKNIVVIFIRLSKV